MIKISRLASAAFYMTVILLAPLANAQDKPNIVVIYADDHAQHAVSAYGSTINRTPNIDQLARDGFRFVNSFVANSICGPARATLLSGLHSHANGQTSNRSKFRDELPTFAKSLNAIGYDTAVVGKWHVSTRPNGFSQWLLKRGGYYNSSFSGQWFSDDGTETVERTIKTQGHVTDEITRLSLDWIKQRGDQSKPFMVWISHSAAHRTWAPATRHLNKYAESTIPEPVNLFDKYEGKSSGAATAQMRISRDMFPAYDLKLPVTGKGILDNAAKGQLNAMTSSQREAWDAAFGPRNEAFAKAALEGDDLTRWKYQRYIKNYLRCVDGLDESVKTVRQFLNENGLSENTIVIYSSDQGFFLGDHGWYDKRWMYEESLRTPLIIHWPGVTQPGSTTDQLVQNIDMAPTFIEMAGAKAEPTMHGLSLVPILKGEQPEKWRDAIYYHYHMKEPDGRTSHIVAKHYGVRTARYKLMYFYELDAWECYDLQTDPREMNNIYDNPSSVEVVNGLKRKLRQLRNEFKDETGKAF